MKTNQIQVVTMAEVVRQVRLVVTRTGKQRHAAAEMKISDTDLSNVLRGKNASRALLEHLGLEVRKVFVRKAGKGDGNG